MTLRSTGSATPSYRSASAAAEVLGKAEDVGEDTGGGDFSTGTGAADDERIIAVALGVKRDEGLGTAQGGGGMRGVDGDRRDDDLGAGGSGFDAREVAAGSFVGRLPQLST